MKKQSQRDIILEKLETEGVVDNFWAFHNYILRLGAIIHGLRNEGYNIKTKYQGKTGQKNCHYYLIAKEQLF